MALTGLQENNAMVYQWRRWFTFIEVCKDVLVQEGILFCFISVIIFGSFRMIF